MDSRLREGEGRAHAGDGGGLRLSALSITVGEAVLLAADSCGSEHHPLVLLISGAGAPAAFWPDTFCRDLASAGRHVVRYCHRDTGASTHFDDPYPIGELLADLIAVVDRLGGDEVHLVGHSMGGYLAELAMVGFPGRFASVTSLSAGPTVSPDLAEALGLSTARQSTWDILMQNHPTGDFDDDLPGWLRSWRVLNGSRRFDEDAAVRYTRSLYDGDPRNIRAAANHIHAMRTVPRSLADDLGRVRCPFLVMHGSEDPLVPLDNGEASARLVAGSTMRVLRGAGHMFFTPETWDEIREGLVHHSRRR
jgi:pimeloyl-ACP methyl ester carboxylesterase